MNLGLRIMQDGALDQKIWALEDCRGKIVFSRGSGVFLKFLVWLEGLGTDDRGSCQILDLFRDFCGIFGVFNGLRT
jgi:hypothetical protein